MTKKTPEFAKETDLCAAFIAALDVPADHYRREKWVAYPETAEFDILLVRESDGAQIGIEAKLRLNAHVVCQALPQWRWQPVKEGPDFRAVLVPFGGVDNGLTTICDAIGVTVIRMHAQGPHSHGPRFSPYLPTLRGNDNTRSDWFEWCPDQRCKLPDYVPDVVAGSSAPTKLTPWKIAAIKLAIILEDRPVTRDDFRALDLSASRWMQNPGAWLQKVDGGWIAGPYMPNFRAQHPVNYEQIKADKATWLKAAKIADGVPAGAPMKQGALL